MQNVIIIVKNTIKKYNKMERIEINFTIRCVISEDKKRGKNNDAGM